MFDVSTGRLANIGSFDVTAKALVQGNTQSCGCLKTKQPAEVAVNFALGNLRKSERCGRHCTLSREKVKELIFGDCAYCERPPEIVQTYAGGEVRVNGIDRIDPAGDYTDSNTASCYAPCNYLKWIMPLRVFYSAAVKVAESLKHHNPELYNELVVAERPSWKLPRSKQGSFGREKA